MLSSLSHGSTKPFQSAGIATQIWNHWDSIIQDQQFPCVYRVQRNSLRLCVTSHTPDHAHLSVFIICGKVAGIDSCSRNENCKADFVLFLGFRSNSYICRTIQRSSLEFAMDGQIKPGIYEPPFKGDSLIRTLIQYRQELIGLSKKSATLRSAVISLAGELTGEKIDLKEAF